MEMPGEGMSRREFVQGTAAAGALSVVPARVLRRGQEAEGAGLNVACIGVGGMGHNDVRGVTDAGATVVALCDVDDVAAENSFVLHPDARRYRDFRELLTQETAVDAVTVSTPDHTHAVIALAALRAGKHVYTQKPLVRTMAEARAIREEAERRPAQITQMGNQGHAMTDVRVMREWVEAGLIGQVREVHLWTNRPIWPQGLPRPTELHEPPVTLDWDLWLGPALERPYSPAYAPFRWRGWWDFGTGALGDMACHMMDAAYWILDLGYPTRIEAECSRVFTETAPQSSRVVYSYPARGARPALTIVWRDGALVPQRPPEWPQNVPWPFATDGGQLWIGEDGKMVAGVYSQNPRLLDTDLMRQVKESPLEERYPRTSGVYGEWLTAIKAGQKSGSDFATYAARFTEMILLGCIAQRLQTSLDIDPGTGSILSDVPPELIDPPYRDGWSLTG